MNTTNSSNQSPLDIACRYSQGDSVQMLLEAGADPDKSHNGCHPIHIAVDAKSDSCVATLLEFHPEQVNVRDSKYGGTPLHWAKTKEVKPLLALYSSANIFIYSHDQTPTAISGELRSTRRRTNSPTPTRRRIKSSRDVGELVVNPIQLIRS